MYRYGNILLFLVCFIAHTNMMTQKAILVIGYNNTRVNDVKKIAALGKEHLDAVTVLVKNLLCHKILKLRIMLLIRIYMQNKPWQKPLFNSAVT